MQGLKSSKPIAISTPHLWLDTKDCLCTVCADTSCTVMIVYNILIKIMGMHDNTVEPPNKGHFGNGHFVLFSEAVPISEACHCLTII